MGIKMKPLVIDMRYPNEHAHAFPFKGVIHVEIDEHTPSKSLHPCTMKIVLHELLDMGAITDKTLITFISVRRLPAPVAKTIVTLIPQDA